MNAVEYLDHHWGPRAVWTHLKNKKHRHRLATCASFVRGDTVCDVGCAFGHSTEIMAAFRPGEWSGVEFSSSAVEKARELFPARTWTFFESIDDLGRASGSVDSTVCSEVMEHVEDDGLLVRRVVEIARRRAVFSTPSVRVNDPGHLRLYTAAALEELFQPWPHRVILDPPFFFIVVDREGNFE